MALFQFGQLFGNLPQALSAELSTVLVAADNIQIERIISCGQASPPGFWYDQDRHEWVMVMAGSAILQFEGEPGPRRLGPGDFVNIPAGLRHRVVATDPAEVTVWLAIFYR